MSTLNRALSKIYGRAQTESCDAPSNCDAGGELGSKQGDSSQVSRQGLDELSPAARSSEPVLMDFANLNVPSELLEGDSVQSDGAIIRMDAPTEASTVPHFRVKDQAEDELAESREAVGETAEVPPLVEEPEAERPTPEIVAEETAAQALVAEETLPEPEPTRLPASTLHPEWEVDRFRWPETCQRLLLEKDEVLEAAVDSLCQANPRGGTIVALVAEKPGDGASTMALCIARCAAHLGRRVIVVDADVSSPGLATVLGLNTPCSWHDSVSGDAPLAESIVLSVEDQLSMMPLHQDCQQSDLTLTDPRVAELLREASASNDLIVLDCGSIDRLAERADMGQGQLPCDVGVVVRDASRQNDVDADEVVAAIRELKVKQVLLAENFANLPKPSDQHLKNSAA